MGQSGLLLSHKLPDRAGRHEIGRQRRPGGEVCGCLHPIPLADDAADVRGKAFL